MLKIKNKNLYLNRGDAISIQVACNNANFEIGDSVTFYVMTQNDCEDVLLSKTVYVTEEKNTVDIQLTSEETRFIEPFKTGYQTFWYEIEYNGEITLMGYDSEGPKLFIMYPEATERGSI